MRKLVKEIAPLLFIYDVDFRNFPEMIELGFGEHLSWKVDYVSKNSPYNVRNDRKGSHVDYNAFVLNDMKDIVKVLGDFMKPGVHEHVFYSALQFFLFYNALSLEKRKSGPVPVKVLGVVLSVRRARV